MQIYTEEASDERSLKWPAILSDEEYEELEARPRYAKYGTMCPTCGETQPVKQIGHYRWKNKDHECPVDFDNKCFQWKLWRMYELSNIPMRYMSLDWNDIGNSQHEAKLRVDEYVATLPHNIKRGYGLYVFSEVTGTGKTFSGTHILKEAAKLDTFKVRHRGYFAPFRDLLDMHESEWMEQKLMHTNILCIDDVDAPKTEREIAFYPRALEKVVRYRASNDLPMVITSNLTWADLEEHYPRVHSVLSDTVDLIELKGDFDYRVMTGVGRTSAASKSGEVPPIT